MAATESVARLVPHTKVLLTLRSVVGKHDHGRKLVKFESSQVLAVDSVQVGWWKTGNEENLIDRNLSQRIAKSGHRWGREI